MHQFINRRDSLKRSSLAAGGLSTLGAIRLNAADSPHASVRVGIVGCNARGMAPIQGCTP